MAALENTRRIHLDVNQLIFKSFDEILTIVSIEIKKHFIQNNGVIPLWGKIENYVFHFENYSYLFDTEGMYLGENDSINESKAIVKINNKELTL